MPTVAGLGRIGMILVLCGNVVLTLSVSAMNAHALSDLEIAVAVASEKVRQGQFEDACRHLEPWWRRSLEEGWFEQEISMRQAVTWENFLFLRSDYLWRYAFSVDGASERLERLDKASEAHRDYLDFVTSDRQAIVDLLNKDSFQRRARSRLKNYAATLFQSHQSQAALDYLEKISNDRPHWFTPYTIKVWLFCLRPNPDSGRNLSASQQVRDRLVQDESYKNSWRAHLKFFERWRGKGVWVRKASEIEMEQREILRDWYEHLTTFGELSDG